MSRRNIFFLFFLLWLSAPISGSVQAIDYIPEYLDFQCIPNTSDQNVRAGVVSKEITDWSPIVTVADDVLGARSEFTVYANLYTTYSANDVFPDAEPVCSEYTWVDFVLALNFGVDSGWEYDSAQVSVYTYDLTNLMPTTKLSNDQFELLTSWYPTDRTHKAQGFDSDVDIVAALHLPESSVSTSWFDLETTDISYDIIEIKLEDYDIYNIGEYDDHYITNYDGKDEFKIEFSEIEHDGIGSVDFGEVDVDEINALIAEENLGLHVEDWDQNQGIYPYTVQQGASDITLGVINPSLMSFDAKLIPDITMQYQNLILNYKEIWVDTGTWIGGISPAGITVHTQPTETTELGHRIAGWHIQNQVAQLKFKITAEIFSKFDLTYQPGEEDHPIPKFQLNDMYWNFMLYGEKEVDIDLNDGNSGLPDGLGDLGLNILLIVILGISMIGALFILVKLAPRLILRRRR